MNQILIQLLTVTDEGLTNCNFNVSTIAGSSPGFKDGIGTSALFYGPSGITINNAGNTLYIADSKNNRIRSLNLFSGAISTVAGNGNFGLVNGPAASSEFKSPLAIALDPISNSVAYVTDFLNYVIRKIDLVSNTVSTLVGTGSSGSSDGSFSTASFIMPSYMAFDVNITQQFYVTDGNLIRLVDLSAQTVKTIAGSSNGNVNGPLSTATFGNPQGLVMRPDGVLIVADLWNNQIRLVDIAANNVSVLSGTVSGGYLDGPTSTAEFSYPMSVAISPFDSGILFVADFLNNVIREIDMHINNVRTITGSQLSGYLDGPAYSAEFSNPTSVLQSPVTGNLIISDQGNNRIRVLNYGCPSGVNTYYLDFDRDGYGNSTVSISACTAANGYVINGTDCDDFNSVIFPGNPEICDGLDNNCNNLTDEGLPTYQYFLDFDGDSFGNQTVSTVACKLPLGYSSNSTDCNDFSSFIHPGQHEICNSIDDNCNDRSLNIFLYKKKSISLSSETRTLFNYLSIHHPIIQSDGRRSSDDLLPRH